MFIILLCMDSLDLIKKRRVVAGITQKELSKLCGVSQSMIAKIEAGRCEASYSVACKIFGALDSLVISSELKAKDFMKKKIEFCEVDDRVSEVVLLMKKKGISQLPVLDSGKLVGLVSEKVLIDNMDRLGSILKVDEIMINAPPVVSEVTSKNTIVSLLREFPIVLVCRGKEFVGLISKADVLLKM